MNIAKRILLWSMTAPGIFHILLFIQLSAILIYLFRPFWITPPGHVYPIIDKNFFYPNIILQGKEGAWRILDTHTTLFSPYIFAYTFFIILGKLAAVFNFDPLWVFLWARVVVGILFFYCTAWFITTFLPKSMRVLAILFVLAIETGPLLTELPQMKAFVDSRVMLYRHFDLPHHLFAEATGILFIGILILSIYKSTLKRIIAIIITGLVSTISMPAYTFTFALSAFPVLTVWSLVTRTSQRIIPILIIAFTAIILPNILFAFEFAKGPPWTNSAIQEKSWYTTHFIRTEYLSSLLLYVPFILLGIILLPYMWTKWDAKFKLLILVMLSWVLVPLIWVEISTFSWFPMPGRRLTDGYQFLPAGIIAATTIHFIITRYASYVWRIVMGTVLISIALIPSLYFNILFTKNLFTVQQIRDIHMYPTKEIWDALIFTRTLPTNSGIMVREYFGELIPGFSNNRVYIGGVHNYPDWLERQWESLQFFSGQMTDDEAKILLKSSDISYVFYSPDEKAVNKTGDLYTSILLPVFTNTDVTIYRFLK